MQSRRIGGLNIILILVSSTLLAEAIPFETSPGLVLGQMAEPRQLLVVNHHHHHHHQSPLRKLVSGIRGKGFSSWIWPSIGSGHGPARILSSLSHYIPQVTLKFGRKR